MKTIDALKQAVAEHLDALAKDGLYVEVIRVNCEMVERSSHIERDSYRREIEVEMTTAKPRYVP